MVSDLFDDPKSTFGVDIGYDSIKVIQLKKSGKTYSIRSMSSIPLPTGLINKDGVADVEKISQTLKQAINEAKPNRVSGHFVITSLPESQVFSKIITLPKLKPAELEKSIQFEAAELFPVPPEELYLDWQILYEKKSAETPSASLETTVPQATDTNKDDTPPDLKPAEGEKEADKTPEKDVTPTVATQAPAAPQVEILVVAAPKKIVESYQEVIGQTGLELAILETKSISSARAILEPGSKDCLVLMDMGAETTGISILDEGILRFTGTVNCGCNSANRALIQKTALPDDQEEKKKIFHEIDQSVHEDAEKKKIIITKSILPIIEELNQSIRYYHNRIEAEAKISKILLTGGGSNLPFITEILEANTGYHTGIANPFANVIQPEDQSYSSFCSYTATLGCALRPYMEQ